jgi:adsorption protein B
VFSGFSAALDAIVAIVFPILMGWLVLSGIDDLLLNLFWVRLRFQPKEAPPDIRGEPEKTLAIFVPLWQEHEVVRQMVTHNVTALRYRNYHLFIGGYPNDTETLDEIRAMEDQFPHVHLALVPHDGPTSKADCLNWAFQTMMLYEEQTGTRFDGIVTHDAEDMIHPDSLRWISHYLSDYDMVQVPVLALPTPLRELVHGVYIDEFSEFQTRDLQVRESLGGFLPGSGVGTGFSRRALEALAVTAENRIFEPSCLTEDYENGFRLRHLGCRQTFLPVRILNGIPMATREYFPRTWKTAVKQRTRWVTGIAWQGWERHGWQGGWRQWWWHWRDRKGLIGNPAGVVCNLLFLYGLLWPERVLALPGAQWLPFTVLMAVLQAAVRVGIVQRFYGWPIALAAPLRIPVANWINASAGIRATLRYAKARWRREPLVWLKTQHQYPNRFALEAHRPTLPEILVKSGYLEASALEGKPAGRRLQDWLVESGRLSESDLYEALSLQLCMPISLASPETVSREIARSLPAHIVRELQVVPVRVEQGHLVVAGPEAPTETLPATLEPYTKLRVRFELVPRSTFDQIVQSHL